MKIHADFSYYNDCLAIFLHGPANIGDEEFQIGVVIFRENGNISLIELYNFESTSLAIHDLIQISDNFYFDMKIPFKFIRELINEYGQLINLTIGNLK